MINHLIKSLNQLQTGTSTNSIYKYERDQCTSIKYDMLTLDNIDSYQKTQICHSDQLLRFSDPLFVVATDQTVHFCT
jgi:hypothetical protein